MIRADRVIAFRSDRTVYQYGNRCVKVYTRSHSDVDVLREAMNLAAAGEAGVPAPRFIETARQEERLSLVMEYVPGETLAMRMASGRYTPDSCLRILTQAQLLIQAADASCFPGQREELRKKIGRSGLEDTVKRELTERMDGMEEGDALCHGDLSPENLILSGSGSPVAADWKQAFRGSREADAAAAWLSLDMAQGREAAMAYLETYCRASGADRETVMRWVPVMAASRLSGSFRREKEMLLELLGASRKDGEQ